MRGATRIALIAGLLLSIVPPATAQIGTVATETGAPDATQPQVDHASNTGPANTTAAIAPRLPPPPIDESAPPVAFLNAAAQALAAGRTGEAQEAMERAETRALIRSVVPSLARTPNSKSLVQQIAAARDALSRGDKGGAMRLLHDAIADPEASAPAT